ncbi:hypothetical protein BJ546DRAFT_975834 [Cryomyces antarcticus]
MTQLPSLPSLLPLLLLRLDTVDPVSPFPLPLPFPPDSGVPAPSAPPRARLPLAPLGTSSVNSASWRRCSACCFSASAASRSTKALSHATGGISLRASRSVLDRTR